MSKFLRTISFVCFEGDEVTTKNDITTKTEETFTQEQVNTFVADERRKMQTKQREMAAELETLKTNTALTGEERDTLQSRIDDLQNQYLSKEEQARQESEKSKSEQDKLLLDLTAERDHWSAQHSNLLIQTEITKSAADHKAFSVEQITALLAPKTRLTELLGDDGKPTGVLSPVVEFVDIDKDGKDITLNLSVEESVKRMKELERYGNLFEGSKKGGVGGSGSSGTSKGEPDMNELAKAKDQTEYRAQRAKNRTARK